MPQDLLTRWQVQHLRFSVFLTNPAQPSPIDSWVDVVGQDADNTHIKGTGDQRVVTQQGPFRDTMMRADVRRDRVDWFLLPSPPATPDSSLTAGPYDGLTVPFSTCMRTWLDVAGIVANRMAFGAQLSLTPGDRSAALAVLAELVTTVQIDVQNTWDFEYAVNRRRTSNTIADLMINRVAKWTLIRQILNEVDLSLNGNPPRIVTSTVYLPVLTLDVNTIPEHSGPLDQLEELLEELARLGTEIALEGDVP